MAYKHTSTYDWRTNVEKIRADLDLWGVDTYSVTWGGATEAGQKTRNAKSHGSWGQTPLEATVTLIANFHDGRKLTWIYNKQERAVDNLSVLRLAIEALRLNEKRGIDQLMREAYRQLPSGEVAPRRDPYEVLGVLPGSPLSVVEAAYRFKAQAAHPDKGGSNEAMAELNVAYEAVKEQIVRDA